MVPKRFILVLTQIIILTAFIALHTARTDAAGLTKEQKQFLKENKTIVFVSQTHYPPFEFVGSDGDRTGMCIELIRWIATEFGFKAHFTDTSFQQAQENILSGKADVLTSFFYSKKRDRIFDFTQTMFDVPASIFVDSQRPDIKEIIDLNGKIVAMQSGDYAKEFLESKNIKCTFKYTQNFAEATDLVVAGQADALIGDEQIVLYHIFSSNLIDKIKKVGAPLYVGENCMGLKEPGGMLSEIMDAGIDMAQEKGILDQIYKKWLGTTYSKVPSLIQKIFPLLLFVIAIMLFISFLIWAWNLRLRQKVASRTADLSRSEKTLRTILNASPLGIGLSEDSIIKWSNPAMCRMLGYENHELNGKKIDMIYRDNDQLNLRKKSIETAQRNDTGAHIETQWIRKDGSNFDCYIRMASLTFEKKPMIIAIAEDITKQKKAENAIKASLKEKEILLREIHHRVKNNMQVVSSLLSLQADSIKEKKALAQFMDTQTRVYSMALVHDALYQSSDFNHIFLQEYLDPLVQHLLDVYSLKDKVADVEVSAQKIVVKMDHAVSCGLIMVELISNALKHAQPPAKSVLKIEIKAKYESDKCLVMHLKDNGSSVPGDVDFINPTTLGLQIVTEIITGQLEGTYTVDLSQGVFWKIKWPL